ncbi:MAG: adenylate/guanylate cyclase domain-containing protein [Kiloniellaceae bacterium]
MAADPRHDPVEAASVEADLAEAERAGLKLAIKGRTVALLPVGLWLGLAGNFPGNLYGLLLIGFFLAWGLLHHWLLSSGRERRWQRYFFLTVDVAVLGVAAIFMPLSVGDAVPQIITFRAYGTTPLFLILAVAALSLSPGLVLWAGAACIAVMWAVFLWIVQGMARTVTWGDLPPGPTREAYLAVFLDPDFIGTGSRFGDSLFIGLTAVILAVAVRRARNLVRDRAAAERQRAQVQRVFGRYVPEQVAAAILADTAALGAKTDTATVMFLDIEGFTALSEQRSPVEVIAILNAFFDGVAEVVSRHGGVVIGFVGDGVIATFNLPVALPAAESRALAAGRALLDLVAGQRFEGMTLAVRIGLATGPVAAGSVGGGGRQSYTVYGDTVNLAQRLEAKNKELGTRLLACEHTCAGAAEAALREVGVISVKGRAQPVRVFAPAPAG